MNKHDGMLVTAKVLRRTGRRLGRRIKEHGLRQAHEDLAEFEPALAGFIARNSETIAGRLALTGQDRDEAPAQGAGPEAPDPLV
jgi:hypothetical protein